MSFHHSRLMLFALAVSALPAVASAADQSSPALHLHTTLLVKDDLSSVLLRPLERLRHANYRVTGRLVSVDANGVRTSYDITLKVHGLPAALRVFIAINGPANVREHVLLISHPDGQTSIQIAHPGDARPSTLPFDLWTRGPLGSSFSYEDFLESQYFWHNQSVLQTTKYGVRNCDVLKSVPTATDRTHYAEVRTWLDRAIGFPVYVEKTLKGSGAVKEYTYYGLRQTEGVWSASQVEAKVRGAAGSSLLIIQGGTVHAKLDDREFDPVQLTKF